MDDDGGSYTLPVVTIDRKDGVLIESDETYIGCKMTVTNADERFLLYGESDKVRGRGNSSWDTPLY